MRRIGAAVSGAAVVIVLWYFLNSWMDNAGIAFVRGQGWPVSTGWLAAAVGAVFGLVQEFRSRRNEKKQTAAAVWTGEELGLAHTPTVERPDATLPCFVSWASGKDGLTGVIDRVPVSVFDMTSRIETDDGSSYRSETVVLLPAVGLPEFTANPRGFGGWLAHAFGVSGLTFDPAAAGDSAEAVRRFGRTVQVGLPALPAPFEDVDPERQEREEAVRKLFTPNLMSTLLRHPALSYQANGEWLACLRRRVLLPAGDRPELIASALEIRAALLAAAAEPTPTSGIPALPHPTPGQYLWRWLGTLVGVVLGLFGGFFGGAIAAEQWKFWMIVPFIALVVGGVVGGAVGYWVGLVVGLMPAVRRWKPKPAGTPEQQAENRRRSKWQTGCGCFGWFAGWVMGALVFIATVSMFGANRMGGWDVVLFFAFPIIGMVVGFLAFARIGGRISDRRKVPSRSPLASEKGSPARAVEGPSSGGEAGE